MLVTKLPQNVVSLQLQLRNLCAGHGRETSLSPSAETNQQQEGERFKKLQLIPDQGRHSERESRKKQSVFYSDTSSVARWRNMSPSQDWPSAWPTAASFKASAVPLPVRMGYIKPRPGRRTPAPPGKYANLELLKIPNFLHLTPGAIKRHCDAIKKFCTKWPDELTPKVCEDFFPLRKTYSDYCHAGNNIRDPRCRITTTQIPLEALPLDYHAHDKFLTLVEERYNPKTGLVTIVTDRCPTRRQNTDYADYLLTALFFESWKTEGWESKMEPSDMRVVSFEKSLSEKNLLDTVRKSLKSYHEILKKEPQSAQEAKEKSDKMSQFPAYLKTLSETASDSEILALPEVESFKDSWRRVRNVEKENETHVFAYGNNVRNLLGFPVRREHIDFESSDRVVKYRSHTVVPYRKSIQYWRWPGRQYKRQWWKNNALTISRRKHREALSASKSSTN